jgi:hypothetical protein
LKRVGGVHGGSEKGAAAEGTAFPCTGQIGRARQEVMEWGVKTGRRAETAIGHDAGMSRAEDVVDSYEFVGVKVDDSGHGQNLVPLSSNIGIGSKAKPSLSTVRLREQAP